LLCAFPISSPFTSPQPPPPLSLPCLSHFITTCCAMISTTESTQSNHAHTSLAVMWVLVPLAVLILFGAGAFLHRAYRRCAGAASPTEDCCVHPSPLRVSQAIKLSFPAAGITRGRVYVCRGDASPSMLPFSSSPSSSKTSPV